MNVIERLAELTDQMMSELSTVSYEKLEEFIEQRDVLTKKMMTLDRAALTDGDKAKLASILACDSQILERMQQLKQEAGNHLMKINIGKRQKNVYEPEGHYDSVFFDRKN